VRGVSCGAAAKDAREACGVCVAGCWEAEGVTLVRRGARGESSTRMCLLVACAVDVRVCDWRSWVRARHEVESAGRSCNEL
jgi:hypothetical protein